MKAENGDGLPGTKHRQGAALKKLVFAILTACLFRTAFSPLFSFVAG
jgi:hypothetical protein